jgi:hypothetical protein
MPAAPTAEAQGMHWSVEMAKDVDVIGRFRLPACAKIDLQDSRSVPGGANG